MFVLFKAMWNNTVRMAVPRLHNNHTQSHLKLRKNFPVLTFISFLRLLFAFHEMENTQTFISIQKAGSIDNDAL